MKWDESKIYSVFVNFGIKPKFIEKESESQEAKRQ